MRKPRGLFILRDLGGIECADGKKVVYGRLYRSSHLAKLKGKAPAKLLKAFGIEHVVDLRSDSEVAEKPDIIAGGMEYHRFAPLDDEQNPSINRHNRLEILVRIMNEEGGAAEHMRRMYRTLVTDPNCLKAYGELLRLLQKEDDGAVLWHCTQGKDRTGVASAIILMALGAARGTILKDYMRLNRTTRLKNALIFIGVTLIKLNVHMSKALNSFLTARTDYLSAAFEEIDANYGGTSAFLHDALGITDEGIARLRSIYLT